MYGVGKRDPNPQRKRQLFRRLIESFTLKKPSQCFNFGEIKIELELNSWKMGAPPPLSSHLILIN